MDFKNLSGIGISILLILIGIFLKKSNLIEFKDAKRFWFIFIFLGVLGVLLKMVLFYLRKT